MRYHRYRYNIDKWMKQKKWDPFRYYKMGTNMDIEYSNQDIMRIRHMELSKNAGQAS